MFCTLGCTIVLLPLGKPAILTRHDHHLLSPRRKTMTLAVLPHDPAPPSWLHEYERGHPELRTDTRYLIHEEPTDLPLSETPSFFPGAASASPPPRPFQACPAPPPGGAALCRGRCVTQAGLISTSRCSSSVVTQCSGSV